jgi:hypothetical protein
MSETVIPDTAVCSECGAAYVDHSAGSRFCPDANSSDVTRAAFHTTTFAD